MIQRKTEAEEAMEKLRNDIAFMIGDVNIGANCSTKAFKDYLYKTLGLPVMKVTASIELLAKLREYLRDPRSRVELQKFCEIKSRDHFRNKILIPLIDSKKIKLTIPDKPTSSKQKYVWNDN